MNIKFFELRYLFKINKYIEFIPLTILNITNENIISIFFYIYVYIFLNNILRLNLQQIARMDR